MKFEALKVGELAKRTGLTVRTLHHYDEIGLLKPSLHSEGGYRLYTAKDIARLQQVLSLRHLGFSLEEVRGCLDQPGFSPLEVIALHLSRLREQIESHGRLCERLEVLAAQLRSSAVEISPDEFLSTIEEMTMLETLTDEYFTPQQAQTIRKGRKQAGPEKLNRMQECWVELIAAIRAEMDQGTDPAEPTVQELARRWQELLFQSTGGDPEIQQGMKRLWEEQGDALVAQFGSQYDSRPIWDYIETAILQGAGANVMNSFASFDGTRIAFSDDGEGPAVILLHGFGMSGLDNFGHFDRLLPKLERTGAMFRELFGAAPPLPAPPGEGRPGLAVHLREAGARVIVPDMRGFGASDKPKELAAYADSAMARDVIALIHHLSLEAVDVLGFSMGSVTGAKLLALGAPHIRSIVLAGVAQYILEGEMVDLPEHFPVPEGLTRPFTMREHAEALAKSLERVGSTTEKPKSASEILVRSVGGDSIVLAAAVRGSVAEQVPVEPLRQVKVPVLLLNGKADLANQTVARLLEVIPSSRSAACDGDHHSTPWQPSFQQAVVEFFKEQWQHDAVQPLDKMRSTRLSN